MTTKNYLKIIFILIIFFSITSCSKDNSWKYWNLNGKVKTITEKVYEVENKFGEWVKADIFYYGHSKTLFSNDGFYEWIEYLDDENELTGKLIPQRDKNGLILEQVIYDEDGKLDDKRIINNISKEEQEISFYNQNGEKYAIAKNFVKNLITVRYDYQTISDNRIDEEYFTTYTYDKEFNQISQKTINKKGDLIQLLKFEYLEFDKNHNWTKKLVYDSEEGENPIKIVIREYEYY